jgi:malate dehydrogenase (oxaloacetate-decarboxylating)
VSITTPLSHLLFLTLRTHRFVQLVRKYHPHCLLHFEDFGVTNAQRLLELYRSKHAVFNDDVCVFLTLPLWGLLLTLIFSQGTGAVTLAAIMAAVGVTKTKLSDQRYIIFGAGTAGLGIARQLRDAVVVMDGLSQEEANKLFYLIDKFGLIQKSLDSTKIRSYLAEFVRQEDEWGSGEAGLLEVVKQVKPTVLIGTSTMAGAFTEEVVREMAKGTERPIILPLSNPSRLVEVDPAQANEWTKGKALLATGSPFPPAKMPNGKDYMCVSQQCLSSCKSEGCLIVSPNATVRCIYSGHNYGSNNELS